MLQRAKLARIDERLDFAMFFVESLRRISNFSQQTDRQNDLIKLLKSGLEENQGALDEQATIAEAKAILPISDLEPWIEFLAEASNSQLESRPFSVQACENLDRGTRLIGRVALRQVSKVQARIQG